MKTTITLFFTICLFVSMSGQIEFVGEVSPGAGSVETVIPGVALDENTFIFAAENSEQGREPYVINESGLSLLGDLVAGGNDSYPKYFTSYKGLVYFLAFSDEGNRMFQTDGTPEGTVPAFGLGDETSTSSSFSQPLVSRGGLMYFSYQGSLYSYDGETLTKIEYEYPIDIPFVGNYKDYPSCLYNDGIALINFQQNGAVLLSVVGNTVETLAELPYSDNFDDYYGLEAFEGGMIFTVNSFSSSVEGNYTFDAATGNTKKIGDGAGALRTTYIDDKSCIATNFKGATYAFSADNNEGIEIFEKSPSLSTDESWEIDRVLNGVLFKGEEDSFEDTEIVFYNPEMNSANSVHTTDDASSILTEGLYSFYFAESELGEKFGDSDLFAYDHNSGTVSPIWTLVGDNRSMDVTPVAVINDEIYFFADVDDNIGRELYKYPLDFTTSTEETIVDQTITLDKKDDNLYVINSEITGKVHVDIYTVDGQKVQSSIVNSNDVFEIARKGVLIVAIAQDGELKSVKIFN